VGQLLEVQQPRGGEPVVAVLEVSEVALLLLAVAVLLVLLLYSSTAKGKVCLCLLNQVLLAPL
jgi:hypothetical protein